MSLPWTDKIATLLVATAISAYVAWLALADQPGETSVRVMVGVVLVLGVAASASAVVPGFEELLRSPRPYLVVASLIGLGAFVAGVLALTRADKAMLAVLVAATGVLWAMSTVRHVRLAEKRGRTAGTLKNRQRVPVDHPR